MKSKAKKITQSNLTFLRQTLSDWKQRLKISENVTNWRQIINYQNLWLKRISKGPESNKCIISM